MEKLNIIGWNDFYILYNFPFNKTKVIDNQITNNLQKSAIYWTFEDFMLNSHKPKNIAESNNSNNSDNNEDVIDSIRSANSLANFVGYSQTL